MLMKIKTYHTLIIALAIMSILATVFFFAWIGCDCEPDYVPGLTEENKQKLKEIDNADTKGARDTLFYDIYGFWPV